MASECISVHPVGACDTGWQIELIPYGERYLSHDPVFLALHDRLGLQQSLDKNLEDISTIFLFLDPVYPILKLMERGQTIEDSLIDPVRRLVVLRYHGMARLMMCGLTSGPEARVEMLLTHKPQGNMKIKLQ